MDEDEYQSRIRIRQEFKSVSPELLDIHIRKYLKNVVDSQGRQMFIDDNYDLTIEKLCEMVPDSWENRYLEHTLLPFLVEEQYREAAKDKDNWVDNGIFIFSSWEPSPHKLARVIRDELRKRNDGSVYGKFVRYAFKNVNFRNSMLSVAIYDQNKLDMLFGKVTPYKTQIVVFIPDLRSPSALANTTLTNLLEKMYEAEIRTGSADILK